MQINMQILLAVPMPPSSKSPGAIPVLLHALLKAITPRHQVTIVVPVGPEKEQWQAVKELCAQGFEVHTAPLIHQSQMERWVRRWHLLSEWSSGHYPWRSAWFHDLALQRVLDQLLLSRRFDLVQIEDNAMGAYQYRTDAPVLFTEHEVRLARPIDWKGWRAGNIRSWMFREADWHRWPRYEMNVWQRMDRIQVFTQRDATSIKNMLPTVADRVRINPFAIEIPAPLDARYEQNGHMVFIGNFTHAPNVDAALWLGLEIMPRLRERVSGLQLDLVGVYPPSSVQALACDDIHVTGLVPDTKPYLERAAVVLAPVRIGGGMRMKVLQAMAMGKAVVTTSRGAEGLQMEDSQPPLKVADDVEGIVNATTSLASSADARLVLGLRARQFVIEHHSPAAYSDRLEAIYNELQRGEVSA